MDFATVQDVKDHAIFKQEIGQLNDTEIEYLIKRAQRIIINRLGKNFSDETNVDTLFDLNIVTVFMVDKLFTINRPENAEDAIIGVQSETILERSQTLSANKLYAAQQFEAEFDAIMSRLRAKSFTRRPIFEVGRGPSYRGNDTCDTDLN